MIHPKIFSPVSTPQRNQRQSNNGRILIGSAKTVKQNEKSIPIAPTRYADLYKQKRAQTEIGDMFKKKKSYPIAPDAFIPNSSFRTIFKAKQLESAEIKAFRLRLDILENLQNKNNKNLDWQDDDNELAELDDSDAASRPSSVKKKKGTLVSDQKDTLPDLFKRLQNEAWWKQEKVEKLNIHSMLLYLNEILKLKQIDSYASACYYIIEIFRTYGIEPTFVNQILDILFDHLIKNEKDSLELCTIRTIAQFMIERKDIVIPLLEYSLKCPPNDIFQEEVLNAIKFITDVNNSDDIDLVLDNMSFVYDSPEDNFSLKMIIKQIDNKRKIAISDAINEEGEETDEVHPLLKKISEERWFPRENFPITLDFVLDAIISKLPNATKTTLKTLITHLVQLHRVIGYSNEQFDRASNASISLLGHNDADYRLIAATTLANLGKETKTIDIVLLNLFLNDPRILVRTECGDSLKKLTGIMSDTVLKDCADDISYLQTLSEENFSLQNYLKEKNRVPTPPPPPPPPPPPSLPIEEKVSEEENIISTNEIEQNLNNNQIEKNEDITLIIHSRSPSPQIINDLLQSEYIQSGYNQSGYNQSDVESSFIQPPTPVPTQIRVEINGKSTSFISHTPTSRNEQTPIQTVRQKTQPMSPVKTPVSDQINKRRRSSLLPNNTNMWDSYEKQKEITEQKENHESQLNSSPLLQRTLTNQEKVNDLIQTIIEEHKQTVGFFRIIPNRRILIPHKISMDNILADQTHIIINRQSPSHLTSTMKLSDLNHNQYHLNEIESVELLSSLVIRAVQIHKQNEKFSPGLSSTNSTNILSISPIQLHSAFNLPQLNVNPPPKLPSLVNQGPTSRQFARIQSNMQAKATREGINVQKAENMKSVLSNLLKTDREKTKSTIISSLSSYPSIFKQADVTHAGLLAQFLKSHGTFNSENYLQKIIRSYPKFIPLLRIRIPQNLISVIWNDPIMKQIASIFSHKQDESIIDDSWIKRSDTKASLTTIDDEHSCIGYDYLTLIHSDDHKKKFLPSVPISKINQPRHVLKFGFREIEIDSSESSNLSLYKESKPILRKRRVYMHLMMSPNENIFDRRNSVKNELRQMLKTEYRTHAFVPIVARPPMCH